MNPTTEYVLEVLSQEKRSIRVRLNTIRAKANLFKSCGNIMEADELMNRAYEVEAILNHLIETHDDLFTTFRKMEGIGND